MKTNTNTIFVKFSNDWRLLAWPCVAKVLYWHVSSDLFSGSENQGGSGLASPPKTQQLSDNFWVSPHTAGSIFIISLKLLHRCLAQKGVPFNWSAACAEALTALKDYLTQAPVLAYPRFDHSAGTFHLQTDACAVGLGAMLKQNGHPVAYASCALTSPEICCHSKRMSRNNVCPKPILTLSIGWPFQNLDRSCTLSAFLLSATFCVL